MENKLKNINLRSEEIQDILGTPPSWLTRFGSLFILLALLTIVIVSAIVEYPDVIKFLKEELIYVKGPYLKPWNMCICFTVGPQEYMKKFLSRMLEAKKEKIF